VSTGGSVDRLEWQRSTFSESGNCVEVAHRGGTTLMRNSNDPSGTVLCIAADDWTSLLMAIRSGEFDQIATP
jgi:hypothetical protein